MTFTILSDAITASQTSFGVASAVGISGQHRLRIPDTILLIDREYILVVAEPMHEPPNTTLPTVIRGYEGTVAVAHAKGALVQVGHPSDYPPSGIVPRK